MEKYKILRDIALEVIKETTMDNDIDELVDSKLKEKGLEVNHQNKQFIGLVISEKLQD